jgi:hypothetical protein
MDQIHLDLAKAMETERLAEADLAPFAAACTAADASLAWLVEQHGPGPRACPTTRDLMLAAYEARRIAYHAAYPSRKQLKEAQQWGHALRKRLRELVAELE